VCALKHRNQGPALLRKCRTQAGIPTSIFLYSRELRTRAAAGQGSRTRIAGFDAVLSPAFATALMAQVVAAVSLRLNAQVKAPVSAGLGWALTATLKDRVCADLARVLRA